MVKQPKISGLTLILGLLLLLFSNNNALGKNRFKFVSISGLAEQEIAAKMVVPIFESADFDIEIQPMPAERAKVEVTSGRRDGDLLRIYSYGKENPTLLRVPTPYYEVKTTAFALKSKRIQINEVRDLDEFRIAIVRGVQSTIDITEGIPDVIELTRLEQAVKFIQSERADIFITSDVAAFSIFRKLHIETIEPIFYVSSQPLYIYLNPKHKEAVQKIDSAIQKLLENGQLTKLKTQLEQDYLVATD